MKEERVETIIWGLNVQVSLSRRLRVLCAIVQSSLKSRMFFGAGVVRQRSIAGISANARKSSQLTKFCVSIHSTFENDWGPAIHVSVTALLFVLNSQPHLPVPRQFLRSNAGLSLTLLSLILECYGMHHEVASVFPRAWTSLAEKSLKRHSRSAHRVTPWSGICDLRVP